MSMCVCTYTHTHTHTHTWYTISVMMKVHTYVCTYICALCLAHSSHCFHVSLVWRAISYFLPAEMIAPHNYHNVQEVRIAHHTSASLIPSSLPLPSHPSPLPISNSIPTQPSSPRLFAYLLSPPLLSPHLPFSPCRLVDILANGETVNELVVEAITVLGSLAHGEGSHNQMRNVGLGQPPSYACGVRVGGNYKGWINYLILYVHSYHPWLSLIPFIHRIHSSSLILPLFLLPSSSLLISPPSLPPSSSVPAPSCLLPPPSPSSPS